MFSAILVSRLQILKFLSQVIDVGFQLSCFRLQSTVDVGDRAENEPAIISPPSSFHYGLNIDEFMRSDKFRV
jgi:hypothetical protein